MHNIVLSRAARALHSHTLVGLLVLVTAIGGGGCVRFGVAVGVGLPAAEETPVDPAYANEPPCAHPGDSSNRMPCSPTNPIHASYWNSRPDKYRIACINQPKGYCMEATGMVPHCHGYGTYRFCHSHPGGAYTHNHITDGEFTGKLASAQ